MARIYARKKGKSGSKKVVRNKIPEWQPLKEKEVIEKIIELKKEGKTKAEIGLILRDSYGIPSIRLATNKKLQKILLENGFKEEYPEDLINLIKKAVNLRKHLEKNKKDIHNKRSLQLTESKIRRLGKYYIKKKKLPENWKYKPNEAELLVR
ncbi:MAG TPA: 30S ribosomal protein S15 [Candidatus Aenigmarchaeota archaeon]|nr:MAG: 30S ribosomal protein S15 [Candidatus Aenigmarchaeota archaeon]HDI06481.1 30S ribosomal protein S15 [Candidatus Aenigmarchaeota archaeon]